MMTMLSAIEIRKYEFRDRACVRKLCYQTAFLENADLFVDGEEILSDTLSLYFTDYEPESCFVVVGNGKVVGYLLGTKDIARMNRINFFIIINKMLFSKSLFRPMNLKLLYNFLKSCIKGEFLNLSVIKKYQATFHINIDRNFRGQQCGGKLIHTFLEYLKQAKIYSVYVSTLSKEAKDFFVHYGFEILYYRKRSYLKYRLGKSLNCYVLGCEFK